MVPFLVLLPLIENGDLMEPGQSTMSLLAALGPTALQARPLITQFQVLTPNLHPNYEPAGCAGAHRAAGVRLLLSNAWSCLHGLHECSVWNAQREVSTSAIGAGLHLVHIHETWVNMKLMA